MTQSETESVPETPPAPPVMWNPELHAYRPGASGGLLDAKAAQNAVDELNSATTIAALRDAMLNFISAGFGLEPRA